MNDITKGLNSAIIVAREYNEWREGPEIEPPYNQAQISLALSVVIEAATVLLVLEELKSERAPKKGWVETLKRLM